MEHTTKTEEASAVDLVVFRMALMPADDRRRLARIAAIIEERSPSDHASAMLLDMWISLLDMMIRDAARWAGKIVLGTVQQEQR